MNYARIEKGAVVEIIEACDPKTGELADINDLFHPDIVATLVPDTDSVAVLGGTWDGTSFGPIPAPIYTVANAKAESRRRILALAPEWKQRNMLARSIELLRKDPTISGLTAAEANEAAKIEKAWAKITAVRTASNQLEAEITNGTYTRNARDWPGWPE